MRCNSTDCILTDYFFYYRYGSISFIIRNTEFYIPVTQNIDIAAEIIKLEEELNYTRGFLRSVDAKLGNAKFVGGAPENVVAAERKKKSDAEERIHILEEQIRGLIGWMQEFRMQECRINW